VGEVGEVDGSKIKRGKKEKMVVEETKTELVEAIVQTRQQP
jgi:hypothetical protein